MTLAGIQFTHVLDFMIIMPLGPQLRDLFAINDERDLRCFGWRGIGHATTVR